VGFNSLQLSVVIPQDLQGNRGFKGLLGTIDGDPTNDFLNSSGTLISSDSTEKEIFYNFGQSCEPYSAIQFKNYRSSELLFSIILQK